MTAIPGYRGSFIEAAAKACALSFGDSREWELMPQSSRDRYRAAAQDTVEAFFIEKGECLCDYEFTHPKCPQHKEEIRAS